MLGRQVQTRLPCLENNNVKQLPKLKPGDPARIRTDGDKNWKMTGVADSAGSTPRSHMVQTEKGNTLRRNRRHLQAVPQNNPPPTMPDDSAALIDTSAIAPSPAIGLSPDTLKTNNSDISSKQATTTIAVDLNSTPVSRPKRAYKPVSRLITES